MAKVGALLVPLVVWLVAACGHGGSGGSPQPLPQPPASSPKAVVRPVGLDIPAIVVHTTSFTTLVTGSGGGSSGCPRDAQSVAWDPSGVAPGDPGLAQVTASGQGVFQNILKLGTSDSIIVHRSDGTQVTFKKVGSADSSDDEPIALQLTTCGSSTSATVYADRVS